MTKNKTNKYGVQVGSYLWDYTYKSIDTAAKAVSESLYGSEKATIVELVPVAVVKNVVEYVTKRVKETNPKVTKLVA